MMDGRSDLVHDPGTSDEQRFLHRLRELRRASRHSLSVATIEKLLGQPVTIDACFLSNPYATELFAARIEREVVATGRLLRLLESYPPTNDRLAADLGPVLGIDPEWLFVTNGAAEAIQAVLRGHAAGRTLLQVPTFSPYHQFATGEVVTISCLDADPRGRAESLLRAVRRHRPDTVVIINPNNPDGFCYPPAELAELLRRLSPLAGELVLDESFLHLSTPERPQSQVGLVSELPNLTLIRSMSKDHGIAGLRLGYAVMAPDRVRALRSRGYLWNCNGFINYVISLLADPGFQVEYERARTRYLAEVAEFRAAVGDIPASYAFPGQANFALLRLDDGVDATEVVGRLLYRHGIYVRPCDDKLGLDRRYLRVAARRAEENQQVLKALHENLTEVGRAGGGPGAR